MPRIQSPSRPSTANDPLAVAAIVCASSAAGGCAAVNANMSKEHIQAWAERTVPAGTSVAAAQQALSRNRIKSSLDENKHELRAHLEPAWWYIPIVPFLPVGWIEFPYDEDQRVTSVSVYVGGLGP